MITGGVKGLLVFNGARWVGDETRDGYPRVHTSMVCSLVSKRRSCVLYHTRASNLSPHYQAQLLLQWPLVVLVTQLNTFQLFVVCPLEERREEQKDNITTSQCNMVPRCALFYPSYQIRLISESKFLRDSGHVRMMHHDGSQS